MMIAARDPYVVPHPHLAVDDLVFFTDENPLDLEIRAAVRKDLEIQPHIRTVLDQIDHARPLPMPDDRWDIVTETKPNPVPGFCFDHLKGHAWISEKRLPSIKKRIDDAQGNRLTLGDGIAEQIDDLSLNVITPQRRDQQRVRLDVLFERLDNGGLGRHPVLELPTHRAFRPSIRQRPSVTNASGTAAMMISTT